MDDLVSGVGTGVLDEMYVSVFAGGVEGAADVRMLLFGGGGMRCLSI